MRLREGLDENSLIWSSLIRRHLDAAAGIQVPTLCIVGQLDRAISGGQLAALAARIPEARLEIIAGAAHLAPLERPAEAYVDGMSEAILHTAIYAGVPAANSALSVARDTFAVIDAGTTNPS